ncbi:uncharacterized protein [Henckelia pumila]|uniref:uncharacterized protein n=1 Tax=Henckelia pumila TaxID=405737 RepID=UPI003C6E5E7D
MRVAVVGGGISGLVSAYVLVKEGVEAVIYEKEDYLGGAIQSRTVVVDGALIDLDFTVFDQASHCPYMREVFDGLGLESEFSNMSFSLSINDGQGYEWGTRNGLKSLFVQKKNILNPYFWKIIREITKFKDDVLSYLEELETNPDIDRSETLHIFIKSKGYSELFIKSYLVPICASIWSCSSVELMGFSAYSVLSFCRSHKLFMHYGSSESLIVRWGSKNFESMVKKELESKGCQIRTNTEVHSVSTNDLGCVLIRDKSGDEIYDGCIIAADAPVVLNILGNQATYDESRILGAFEFTYSDLFLHRDKSFMPKNPTTWSAWNFTETNDQFFVTYWLNALQDISDKGLLFLATLNPPRTPEHTLLKWSIGRPFPSVAASKASSELKFIQGKRNIWFSGAYQGYGFHENGVKAGILAANGLLRRRCNTGDKYYKQKVMSWPQTGARLIVTMFLKGFIATGCLILLDDGGTTLAFEGTTRKSLLKVLLRIHSPQFYWKVATKGHIGLAEAYIDGDFSMVDSNEGLVNLYMLFHINRNLESSASELTNERGQWAPLLFTSLAARFFFKHDWRQSRTSQNNLVHYDLGSELFELFLDETMSYSCAIYETQVEDLKIAQLRKIHTLIEKARIGKDHHVLEIGCGWGSFAVEAVRKTGCMYTGVTLSRKQREYARKKAKEAGLQDRIKILLCDHRELLNDNKYDRIISCEMIEAKAHEFMEEYFRWCESLLAEDGLLVLQFVSIQDQRRTSGFIKEHFFPGTCLPSLTRITISAMASASKLSVLHLEDIGTHYYRTLRTWSENFLRNKSKILSLGFDEKFIRTWEYYFDSMAAGIKSATFKDYQVLFPSC